MEIVCISTKDKKEQKVGNSLSGKLKNIFDKKYLCFKIPAFEF